MGFLNKLFGSNSSNNNETTFHDDDLGEFTAKPSRGEKVNFTKEIKFLNETGILFIAGTAEQLDASEKATVLHILNNEQLIELGINEALQESYENAEKEYSKWQDHFKFISISTLYNETSITFEEKESLYHFNVHFAEGKQQGVSIDG